MPQTIKFLYDFDLAKDIVLQPGFFFLPLLIQVKVSEMQRKFQIIC